MRYFYTFTRFFLYFSLGFALLTGAVAAEIIKEKKFTFGAREEAIFTLFKFKNETPNYGAVIEDMKTFREAELKYIKNRFYDNNKDNLERTFESYDPQTDYINIEGIMYVRLLSGFKVPVLQIRYGGPSTDDVPVFQYPYAENVLRLDVKDLKEFVYIPLRKQQAEKLAPLFSAESLVEMQTTLSVRPKELESEEIIRGLKHWTISAETGYLALTIPNTNKEETEDMPTEDIVLYKAPWFVKKTQTLLEDLENKEETLSEN